MKQHILCVGKICGADFEWHFNMPPLEDAHVTRQQAEECSGAYVIGEMDADDGYECRPLHHFSELALVESYILGWKDAHAHAGTLQRMIDEAEQTREYEDDMADREFWSKGQW